MNGEHTIVEADFIAALREMKDQARMSVRALSIATRMPPSTLGGYFSGRHLPEDPELVERLVRVLGVQDDGMVDCWKDAAAALVSARRSRRNGA